MATRRGPENQQLAVKASEVLEVKENAYHALSNVHAWGWSASLQTALIQYLVLVLDSDILYSTYKECRSYAPKENEATHKARWSRASFVPDATRCHGDPNPRPIMGTGCGF